MSRASGLIAFFRDCLREERSHSGIENLFGGRVLNRAFLKGSETATQDGYTAVDLPQRIKSSLVDRFQLLRRDTEFLYVTLPVTGRKNGRKICCPLLLYPIRISDGELFLSLEQVRVNPAIFSAFGVPTSAEAGFLDLIPEGRIRTSTPKLLAEELRGYLPELDLTPLEGFPYLTGAGILQGLKTTEGSSRIDPASVVVVCERSKNVAGLLQELEILAEMRPDQLSRPLLKFLDADGAAQDRPGEKGRPEFIPAMLSDSQMALVDSINGSTITACQGPPGTGKSFSIAAAATEQILRGRSVLICCRSNEAADVLQSKLEEMVPSSGQIVRAGRKRHLRKLRGMVARLMSKPVDAPRKALHERLEDQIRDAVKGIYRQEKWLEEEIEDGLVKGEWFQNPPESWWRKIRKWIHIKRMTSLPLLAQVADTFHELHRRRYDKAREYHRSLHRKNLAEAMRDPEVRSALGAYQKALAHRYASDQEKALQSIDPEALLRVFPAWITTTDDLHRVLPLKRGLFDLVVMDEATQCDLPSILPVLQRARRALVTGDPKQLRHLSFLSEDRHRELADLHRLTAREQVMFHYRKVSAMDRALEERVGTPSSVMLNEHFRSLPDLIRFSNERFYHGQLHLMREAEVFQCDADVLTFQKIEGFRDVQGVNQAEIEAAIAICRRVVAEGATGSLGFLSPFRAQVDAFVKTLRSELKPDELAILLKRNRLVAGTGHSFQGDERDGMIVSLCLTNDCPTGVRRFVEREDVFNVSVTRARHWMVVCHSLGADALPAGSLLRDYLKQSVTDVPKVAVQPSLRDFVPTLEKSGWEVIPRRVVSGVPVDLLLKKDGQMVAVDLVGTGGEEGEAVPVVRSLILMRSGVPLMPVRIDEWLHRRPDVLRHLEGLVSETG